MNRIKLELRILLLHIVVSLDKEQEEVEDKNLNLMNPFLVILHPFLIWEEKLKELLKELIFMSKWKFLLWIVFKDHNKQFNLRELVHVLHVMVLNVNLVLPQEDVLIVEEEDLSIIDKEL